MFSDSRENKRNRNSRDYKVGGGQDADQDYGNVYSSFGDSKYFVLVKLQSLLEEELRPSELTKLNTPCFDSAHEPS